MEQSSSNLIVWLDRAALTGLVVSFGLYILPWWSDSLRVGFFGTIAFTIFHIITSHKRAP